MKKLGIGCAVLGGILMLAIWMGSCFVMSKAKHYMSGYAQLAEIPAMNKNILNQSAYAPPADGRMDAQQVERYMAVQRDMHARLGERFKQLNDKYNQITRDLEQKGRQANMGESLGALNDLLAVLIDAKRTQVEALNQAGFSLGEYQWIRQQTLIALGHGAIGFNLEAMAGDPSKMGTVLAIPTDLDPQMLEQNRALLTPYEDSMDQWLTLSFFGL